MTELTEKKALRTISEGISFWRDLACQFENELWAIAIVGMRRHEIRKFNLTVLGEAMLLLCLLHGSKEVRERLVFNHKRPKPMSRQSLGARLCCAGDGLELLKFLAERKVS